MSALKNSSSGTENQSSELPLCKTVSFLASFGVPKSMLNKASCLASKNGTTGAAELIAYCGMKEDVYFEYLAKYLNLPLLEIDDVQCLLMERRDPIAVFHPHNMVAVRTTESKLRHVFAPTPLLIESLAESAANFRLDDDLAVMAPSKLRALMVRELEGELKERTEKHLMGLDPKSSARYGTDGWQGALFVVVLLVIFEFSKSKAGATALGFHLVVSAFFIGCVAVRLLAAASFRKSELAKIEQCDDRAKPTYSVMIPLHDEQEVVPDLIEAMRKLHWPRSKLEIKLVCEADDQVTLDALEAQELDPRFEIIKVPAGDPRTKPKALCYAIGFTTGQYITIYDAEDRPHPEQLLEAYQALAEGDDKLACVQAPLSTTNAHHNFWTIFFHFEYAGLFGGLLPWLARNDYPIMLGGTSNHFKRDALLDIGYWDPYNVTEDADLGLRIWRKGYRTGMITRPTYEDAPRDFKVWLPQRTRWLKGWMQTCLVQMRRPRELCAHMSATSFVITQILLTGTIASALLHPIVLIKAAILTYWTISSDAQNIWITALAIVDWLSVVLSYVGFAVLCWKSSEAETRRRFGIALFLTPLYWMAISLAAWRGLFQLMLKPHFWEKTHHPPHEKEPAHL